MVWKPEIPEKSATQPVEIVYKDKKSNKDQVANDKEKIFVRNVEVPESAKFDDPNDEAMFASEERNRVLLQTRAREVGLTKNRRSGPKFLEDEHRLKFEENPERRPEDLGGFTEFDPRKELQRFDAGESTISVQLPDDIAVGSFTALNTDRHLYYSFYARIEDMIYLRWAENVKKALDTLPTDYKKANLAGKSLRTDLIVLLKPNGEFYRAEVHNSSGIKRFDVSPALAFQDARIFPNPPQEMVREDGFIHISYSFIVDFGRVQ